MGRLADSSLIEPMPRSSSPGDAITRHGGVWLRVWGWNFAWSFYALAAFRLFLGLSTHILIGWWLSKLLL